MPREGFGWQTDRRDGYFGQENQGDVSDDAVEQQLTAEERASARQDVAQVALEATEDVASSTGVEADNYTEEIAAILGESGMSGVEMGQFAVMAKKLFEAGRQAESKERIRQELAAWGAANLDLNSPSDVTEAQVRRADILAELENVNDQEFVESVKRELDEIARHEQDLATNGFVEDEDSEYQQTISRMAENGERLMSDHEGLLTPEERGEKLANVHETLREKANKGFFRVLARYTVPVATAVAVLSSATVATTNTGDAMMATGEEQQNTNKKVDLSEMAGLGFDSGVVDDEATGGEKGQISAEYWHEVNALLSEGEVDLAQYNLDDLGESMYAGFLTEPGSEQAPNGVLSNYTEDYGKYDEKESVNSFARSLEFAYGDSQQLFKELVRVARNQPETLASYGASLPKTLEAAGFDESIIAIKNFDKRQKAVDTAFNGEDGAKLQKRLLAAVTVALGQGSYTHYLENGPELTSYIYHENGKDNTVENLVLGMDLRERKDAKQVQIAVTYADGATELVDLNLPCGGQVNREVDGGERKAVAIDIDESSETSGPEEKVGRTPNVVPDDKPVPTPDDKPNDVPEDVPDDVPEDEPDDEPEDPGDEDDDEEDVKPKDPDNEKKVVDDGGQDGDVGQTDSEDLTEKTDEDDSTPSEGNEDQTESGPVVDNTQTETEQDQAKQDQEEANKNEITDSMSDEDFYDYVNKYLSQ